MNPFTPTFGVSPSVVLGRDLIVERFSHGLIGGVGDPRRTLLISGPRGIGKTITLNELEDAAIREGWVVLRAQPRSLVQPLIDTAIPRALSLVKQGSTGGRRISHDSQPTPSLITELNTLCDAVGKQSGVLVTLDEVQSANPSELWELSSAIQDLRRDNQHIAFAAAGLPDGIATLLKHPGTTFLRRAQHISLVPMTPAETVEILRTTAQEGGITFETHALDDAVALTRGYPFLIQLLGFHLVEEVRSHNRSVIGSNDVASVSDAVLDTLGQLVHEPALAGVPNAQLEYLEAMAQLQEGSAPVSTADIAAHLEKQPQQLTMVRQGLIQRELVYSPRRGFLNFVIPHMAHHLLNGGVQDFGWD